MLWQHCGRRRRSFSFAREEGRSGRTLPMFGCLECPVPTVQFPRMISGPGFPRMISTDLCFQKGTLRNISSVNFEISVENSVARHLRPPTHFQNRSRNPWGTPHQGINVLSLVFRQGGIFHLSKISFRGSQLFQFFWYFGEFLLDTL